MTTQKHLRKLTDSQFHLLGDQVLRRIDTKYLRLRTHGVNADGHSIKGQPDSYVGDSARAATIAVCYTTQKKGWWTKIIDDIQEAKKSCPKLEHIVVAIPHDVDRDAPLPPETWAVEARIAAGNCSLDIFNGLDIARNLDNDLQEIRREHLGIPYSRMNRDSLLASARESSQLALEELQSSMRFDPVHYVSRTADVQLYELWQQCITGDEKKRRSASFLPIVNDSGIGKTSLICNFVSAIKDHTPVILIEARNLVFDRADAIVAHVIHELQGALDPDLRVKEELEIASILSKGLPLTLVIDGLDEVHDAHAVKVSVNTFLRSKLGQFAILITTSRPEFWRTCVDDKWRHVKRSSIRSRVPATTKERDEAERDEASLRLPSRFTRDELHTAWAMYGLNPSDLYRLDLQTREELTHPFTLRAYVECAAGNFGPMSRTQIIGVWLKSRLEKESLRGPRSSPALMEEALITIARRLQESGRSGISVDELRDVPRFRVDRPPGPIVEQLISANILQTIPDRPDVLRFSVEAIWDYYLAESDYVNAATNTRATAARFASQSFTKANTRLSRLGERLSGDEAAERFASELADLQPEMALVVMRASPRSYSPLVRQKVCDALSSHVATGSHVRSAASIYLLGTLECEEATDALSRVAHQKERLHIFLRRLCATALIRQYSQCEIEFIYGYGPFGVSKSHETYFDPKLIGIVRSAPAQFRSELAKRAADELHAADQGRRAYAVSVLAYLQDDALLDNLAERIGKNELLQRFENKALLVHGSARAMALLSESVLAVGEQLSQLADVNENLDSRNSLYGRVVIRDYDMAWIRYPCLTETAERLLSVDNSEAQYIASQLIVSARVAELIPQVVIRGHSPSWRRDAVVRALMTAKRWLAAWQAASTDERSRLLEATPICPSAAIEEIAIESLRHPALRFGAARALAEYGATYAAPIIREVLKTALEPAGFSYLALIEALGDLCDVNGVPVLANIAELCVGEDNADVAVFSLRLIGSSDAEAVLVRLQKQHPEWRSVAIALVYCGSHAAIDLLVSAADRRVDGVSWLIDILHGLTEVRGWTAGRYLTHIKTEKVTSIIEREFANLCDDDLWDLYFAYAHLDSEDIRHSLRSWLALLGSASDRVVRKNDSLQFSRNCLEELCNRADEFAIPFVLGNLYPDDEDSTFVYLTLRQVEYFEPAVIAPYVRARLANASDDSERIRMTALLGYYGYEEDAALIRGFRDSENRDLANIADENHLRLTDPLLIPPGWREM